MGDKQVKINPDWSQEQYTPVGCSVGGWIHIGKNGSRQERAARKRTILSVIQEFITCSNPSMTYLYMSESL